MEVLAVIESVQKCIGRKFSPEEIETIKTSLQTTITTLLKWYVSLTRPNNVLLSH